MLGISGFALYNAWKMDYYPQATKTQTANQTTPAATPKTTDNGVSNAAQQPAPAPAPAARLIKIQTDVLAIWVDTAGGNIVQADLLKYPDIIYQDKPVTLLTTHADRYYTTQSGLTSDVNSGATSQVTNYTADKHEYILAADQDSITVKLHGTTADGLATTKTLVMHRAKYAIDVDYSITNKTNQAWSGKFYTQIKRKDFGTKSGLFAFNTYTGAAISSKETPYEKISFAKIKDITKDDQGFIHDSKGGWVAMQQRYFLSAWIPSQDHIYRYFGDVNDGIYTIGLSDDHIKLNAGETTTIKTQFYTGPEITENLAPLANGLDHTVDYGWLWAIAIVFFWILKKINLFIGNWGWSIIILTFLIKLAFYKLSESSCRSMAKMRELMPKMQAIKERCGDDKQKLQQATMELYKKEGINPLNLGGCLPMLIQIPFFIALYYVLMGAVELRHAPFMLWIHDLAAQDPYYVLPILMGLSMFAQQRLNPSSADPTQAKMMMFMPVIFTFFFLNFPAGLVLYWLVSNVLSILQQLYINKKLAKSKH